MARRAARGSERSHVTVFRSSIADMSPSTWPACTEWHTHPRQGWNWFAILYTKSYDFHGRVKVRSHPRPQAGTVDCGGYAMTKILIAFRTATVAAAIILGTFAMESVKAADGVSLITDFGFNGRHAYFFVALDKGYYKDAGLDVKIIGGKGSVDAIRQVGAGNATFGFADTGSLVLARAKDNIPVKTLGVGDAPPPPPT